MQRSNKTIPPRQGWVARTFYFFTSGLGLSLGLYILNAAFGGAIGNFFYDIVRGSPEYFSESISIIRWFPGIIIVLILIAFVLGAFLYFKSLLKDAQIFRYRNLSDLEERLLAFIASPVGDSNEPDEFKSLLLSFLEDVVEVFAPDACRALVLRPDKEVEYLEVWQSFGWEKSNPPQDKQFYIGPHANKPTGVAGFTYWHRNIEAVHIYKEGGRWLGDHPAYIPSKTANIMPDFKSFVVVPIIDDSKACVAILSIDSQREGTFTKRSSEEVEGMLNSIGISIASAIMLYKRLGLILQPPQQPIQPSPQGSSQNSQDG